jgi:hypothetical protein
VTTARGTIFASMGLFALVNTGCVENFNGSKVEMFLSGGVHVPGDDPPGFGRPPSDTHYELYVLKDMAVFKLAEFDIRPVIRRDDPCFIEEPGSRFEGLHSTRIVEKLREAALADGTVDDTEAGDLALASVRVANMPALESTLKVITLHEPGLTERALAERTAAVAAANLIDDASNAARLSECQAIWREHPGYYVGTDKITTDPLAGTYLGMVEGADPRNNIFVGGAALDTDISFPGFSGMRINWSFNDPEDPRRASYPPSTTGFHYMAGDTVQRVRGVYNLSLANQDFGQSISGEIAVYTELGRDDVHF